MTVHGRHGRQDGGSCSDESKHLHISSTDLFLRSAGDCKFESEEPVGRSGQFGRKDGSREVSASTILVKGVALQSPRCEGAYAEDVKDHSYGTRSKCKANESDQVTARVLAGCESQQSTYVYCHRDDGTLKSSATPKRRSLSNLRSKGKTAAICTSRREYPLEQCGFTYCGLTCSLSIDGVLEALCGALEGFAALTTAPVTSRTRLRTSRPTSTKMQVQPAVILAPPLHHG
ncbi:hypothetical protein GQ600_16868 [Phytophthora cactorum]|nr:hypothetical protein GQ600_16868 [Phytophthora cactorum]